MLISQFISKFDSLVKEIFLSIIDKDGIPDLAWRQCCLPINSSGLGYIPNTSIISSAFTASVFSCLSTLNKLKPNFLNSDNKLRISFEYALTNLNSQISPPNQVTLAFLESTQQSGKKLQETLSALVASKELKDFKVYAKNHFYNNNDENFGNKYLTFINSLCGEAIESPYGEKEFVNDIGSKWLLSCPKSWKTTLSSANFRECIIFRLMLPTTRFSPGTKCSCTSTVDPQGHHISTTCNFNSAVTNNHDACAHALSSMASFTGFRVVNEQVKCFSETEPNSRKRPDVSILNWPKNTPGRTALIIDVAIVNPVTPNETVSFNQSNTFFRHGNKRYNAKMTRYSHLAHQNGLDFSPFVIETTGTFHPKSRSLFNSIIDFMAPNDPVTQSKFRHYWLTYFSFALYRSISTNLLKNTATLNSLSHSSSLTIDSRDIMLADPGS